MLTLINDYADWVYHFHKKVTWVNTHHLYAIYHPSVETVHNFQPIPVLKKNVVKLSQQS